MTYDWSISKKDSVAVYHAESLAGNTPRETPWEGVVSDVTEDGYWVTDPDYDGPRELAQGDHLKRIITSEEEAVAVLAAAKMSTYGCVRWVETNGRLIQAWIHKGGCNFSNIGNAFILTIGEIGPVDAYNDEVQAKADTLDGVTTFANFLGVGVRPTTTEGFGYGTPTHTDGKSGAVPRVPEDLDKLVFDAADHLGLIPEVETPP